MSQIGMRGSADTLQQHQAVVVDFDGEQVQLGELLKTQQTILGEIVGVEEPEVFAVLERIVAVFHQAAVFLAPDFIDGVAHERSDVKAVEDHVGSRQTLSYGRFVGRAHVDGHRLDLPALGLGQRAQQPLGVGLGAARGDFQHPPARRPAGSLSTLT